MCEHTWLLERICWGNKLSLTTLPVALAWFPGLPSHEPQADGAAADWNCDQMTEVLGELGTSFLLCSCQVEQFQDPSLPTQASLVREFASWNYLKTHVGCCEPSSRYHIQPHSLSYSSLYGHGAVLCKQIWWLIGGLWPSAPLSQGFIHEPSSSQEATFSFHRVVAPWMDLRDCGHLVPRCLAIFPFTRKKKKKDESLSKENVQPYYRKRWAFFLASSSLERIFKSSHMPIEWSWMESCFSRDHSSGADGPSQSPDPSAVKSSLKQAPDLILLLIIHE